MAMLAVPVSAAGWNDGSFGRGGRVPLEGDPTSARVVTFADGSVAVASTDYENDHGYSSYGVVQRLTPQGRPDPSFGDHGTVRLDSDPHETAYAIVALPDGSLLVGGSIGNRGPAAIWRLLPDGAPDPAFGDGTVALIPSTLPGTAVALQPLGDGAALVSLGLRGRGFRPAVAKILASGALDPSFGDGGIAWVDGYGQYRWIGLDAAGRILLGGFHEHIGAGEWTEWAVRRLLQDGTVDMSFGDLGVVEAATVHRNLGDTVQAMVGLPGGGAYVMSGIAWFFPGWTYVVHLFPNGKLDRGYGVKGLGGMKLGHVAVVAPNLALAPDGGVVAAGFGSLDPCVWRPGGPNEPCDQGLVVMELTPEGLVDRSFGNDGWMRVDRFAQLGDMGTFVVDAQGRPMAVFSDFTDRGFNGLLRMRSPWA